MLSGIRIQDVFDISIIAVMIFVLLTWFKGRASRFVLVGISLLGIVYLLARFFQLYLTTVALQGFFAILLFVLVVIFQEDLRRFFERLAVWGVFRQKKYDAPVQNATAEMIANTAASLSRKKVGALIVVQGNDPLDRHLNGGEALDGIVSQPLLESIFDPHSPGHDGAVLIQGTKIVRFGCHLPLSANSMNFKNVGLRHTAALGLAERSDALCIVVSEERGTISLARREELYAVENAAALKAALEGYFVEKTPPERKDFAGRWLRENPREKVVAVLLAFALWIIFGYQGESVRRDIVVPIEYINVEKDWVIEEAKTDKAKIVLLGSAQGFQLLRADTLKLSVDLSKLQQGWQTIALRKEMVNLPSNLSAASISPSHVELRASRLMPVSYPVEVVTINEPAKQMSVQRITVTPAAVKILLPANLLQKNLKIRTEPINLEELQGSTIIEPKIHYPTEAHFPGGKIPSVKVYIKMKGKAAGFADTKD